MEQNEKYNFWSLIDLCKEFKEDIKARKNLSGVLGGKKVRFIDQEGHFGYAQFGDFYFTSMGVMMLITNESKYTWYHSPDEMNDSFFSTVPVLYAGIETGFKDDKWNEIYTGDIVRLTRNYGDYTMMVRHMKGCPVPSLMGDNCDVLFEEGDKFHIEGNIFYDIKPGHFEIFDPDYYGGHNGIFLYPFSAEEKADAIAKMSRAPFFEDRPMSVKKYPRMYEKDNDTLQIQENDVLFCFNNGTSETEDGSEEFDVLVYDYWPKGAEGHKYETVYLSEFKPDWDELQQEVTKFLLNAHRNPEIRYVVLSWEESIESKSESSRLCELFRPVYEYNLTNVILPAHVMCHFIAEAGIGRD